MICSVALAILSALFVLDAAAEGTTAQTSAAAAGNASVDGAPTTGQESSLEAAIDRVMSLYAAGHIDESIRLMRVIAEQVRTNAGAEDDSTLLVEKELSALLQSAHRLGEAVSVTSALLDRTVVKLGEDAEATLELRALLAAQLGEGNHFPEVEAQWWRIYQSRLRTAGARANSTLGARQSLAVAIGAQGRTDDAAALLGDIITTRIAMLGAAHDDTLGTRYALAGVLAAAGRTDAATTELQTALAALDNQRPGDDAWRITLLEAVAGVAHQSGDAAAWQRALEKLQPLVQQSMGPDSDEVWLLRGQHALAHAIQGDLSGAEQSLREVHAHFVATYGAQDERALDTLNDLAPVVRRRGDNVEAIALWRAYVAGRTAVHGANDARVVSAKASLALTLHRSDQLADAERFAREVLAAREGSSVETAKALTNLGAILVDAQRDDEAEPLLRRALEIFERRLLPPDDPSRLQAQMNVAVLELRLERDDGVAHLRQELEQLTRTRGADAPETLIAASTFGVQLVNLGDPGQARDVLADAFTRQAAILGAEHPDTLSTLGRLAIAEAAQGDYSAARAHWQTQLDALVARGAPSTLAALGARLALAAMREVEGDLIGAAREEEARLFADAAAAKGAAHPMTLLIQRQYTRTLILTGANDEALRNLRAMNTAMGMRGDDVAAHTSSRMRQRNVEARSRDVVDNALWLAVRNPGESTLFAAELIVRGKYLGAEVDAIVARELRTSRDTQTRELAARIETLRAQMSRASNDAQDTERADLARKELELAEGRLASRSTAFARARQLAQEANIAAVVAALPAGALLIDVRLFRPAESYDATALHYGAAIIAADGRPVRVVDLGVAADTFELTRAAADLNGWISDSARAAAAKLYAALFGAYDAELAACSEVFIAPDGPLHNVPFHALVLPDGRYWVQRQPIHVVNTARDLLGEHPARADDDLLVVGGVDYGAQPVAGADGGPANASVRGRRLRRGGVMSFVPLAGSRREANLLQARWSALGRSARTLMDRDANESALKHLPRAPRYLHLATHGFFLPDADTGPMAASGVALADANASFSRVDNDDDGILYAEEVLGMDLEGTGLVVLSACETGRAVLDTWEGSLGLVRAFRIAGAQDVVSTLWPISDEHAAPFMAQFYEHLLADPKRDAAAALRAVQIEWLSASDARAYPENWAPFMLVERR